MITKAASAALSTDARGRLEETTHLASSALGSRSRDSLLWTAHELAAQRHGRLRWSTSPPGEYRPVPSLNPVIEGDYGALPTGGFGEV